MEQSLFTPTHEKACKKKIEYFDSYQAQNGRGEINLNGLWEHQGNY